MNRHKLANILNSSFKIVDETDQKYIPGWKGVQGN